MCACKAAFPLIWLMSRDEICAEAVAQKKSPKPEDSVSHF
jgi:hypothetical protein